jgi:hypothetical protein
MGGECTYIPNRDYNKKSIFSCLNNIQHYQGHEFTSHSRPFAKGNIDLTCMLSSITSVSKGTARYISNAKCKTLFHVFLIIALFREILKHHFVEVC